MPQLGAMNIAPCFRPDPDGVFLSVKVQPRASRNEIGEVAAGELKVKVTAPPVESAANEAVLRLLADELGCARSSVQLVRGGASRHKTLYLRGVTAAMAMKKLVSCG